MPCRDDYPVSNSSTLIYRDAFEIQKKLDEVTAMLCAAMRQAEALDRASKGAYYVQGALEENIPGLKKWWTEHKKIDDERIAKEMEAERIANLKQSAKEKLTAEEWEALGLNEQTKLLSPTMIRTRWQESGIMD